MIAITRDVSPAIADAELTHLERTPISFARAAEQHEQYRALLASLGCTVISIPADAAYPDCVFIEDTAVVLDDIAVITRPGAESRRGEVDAIAPVVAKYRPLARIEAPGTIDGGDVLVLDDRIFVGRSSRTNDEGIDQLRTLTRREVIPVELHGALHLKTAITRVASDTLLINREWLDLAPFAGWKFIDVDETEPFAANAVLVGDIVIFPTAFAKTRAKLAHLDVRTVDADELAKAEGGVTCCSLLLR
ncbi:MAG TPA: arginine deiminase family protein [Thermoanaerobaculia bacterium]